MMSPRLKRFLERTSNEVEICLDLSGDELKILYFVIRKFFMENVDNLNVAFILRTLFADDESDDFEFLDKMDGIKTLHNKRILDVKITENIGNRVNTITTLNCNVTPTEVFLDYLSDSSSVFSDFGLVACEDGYAHLSDYLDDQFTLINMRFHYLHMFKRDLEDEFTDNYPQKIEKYRAEIERRTANSTIRNEIEEIFKEFEFTENEKIIFFSLLLPELSDGDGWNYRSAGQIARICGYGRNDIKWGIGFFPEITRLLEIGVLLPFDEDYGAFARRFCIDGDILDRIMFTMNIRPQKTENRKILFDNTLKDNKIFELLIPKTDMKDVVLSPKIREILDAVLKQNDAKVSQKLKKWGINEHVAVGKKLLFYGPPGTGKTFSALSLAKSLDKEILSFDCSKIISKWVGKSEKNVRKIFDSYKEICKKTNSKPILLLNEADQFLSSRIADADSGAEKSHNQMQNIFLEQIERFEGFLIATTNFLGNLDTAFARRFDYKVEFKKPNLEERLALWRKFLPKNAEFESGFDIAKLAKYELTGAQIELASNNAALKVAVRDDEIFRTSDFIKEIENELDGNFDKEKVVGLL